MDLGEVYSLTACRCKLSLIIIMQRILMIICIQMIIKNKIATIVGVIVFIQVYNRIVNISLYTIRMQYYFNSTGEKTKPMWLLKC